METGTSTEKLLHRLAFVGTRVIQQHNHGTVEMPKQLAEEQTHLLLRNIVIEEIEVEVQPLPFRADRDAGDHRDFIAPIDMTMNRSLPYRSPGLGDIGNEEKSGLVGKYYVGAQPSGFFLSAKTVGVSIARPLGRRTRSQRRSGFWMTPLQTMHQPPNVIGVVVDPELLVDEQGDARRAPQIRVVAASHRPSQQQLDQALQLFRPQLRRSPRARSERAMPALRRAAAHGTSA